MSNLAILTDENGNFVGQKDRFQLEKGDIVATSNLLIENSKGEVLIAQRALTKKYDPGVWSPSAAGTLEPGETFYTNVIKEAEEEIGLIDFEPEEIHRMHHWRADDGTGRYSVWYRAKCDWPIERFKLQKEEVAAAQWIDKVRLMAWVREKPEQFAGWPERWKLMLELTEYTE